MKFVSQCIFRLEQFSHKLFHFGFRVAFWDLLDSQKKRLGKFREIINKEKHSVITAWLSRKFYYLISIFLDRAAVSVTDNSFHSIPPYIWVCWWDGIADAPDIVKICFNSVQKNAVSYKVRLVTKNNFHDFCSIPKYILEKFEKGIISKTHFSDILRMALLAEHGGLWLDATILVTGTIHRKDISFFTIKREYGGESVSRQRWTGFCIGGNKNNILFEFATFFFFEYWKKYSSLIDYFLIDYAIAVAYDFIPKIKDMIDKVPLNNQHLYLIQNNLEYKVDHKIFSLIAKDTIFNKLTWKEKHMVFTSDGNLTFYGYILNNYNILSLSK
jgi:hypothetical protein